MPVRKGPESSLGNYFPRTGGQTFQESTQKAEEVLETRPLSKNKAFQKGKDQGEQNSLIKGCEPIH